ncbi:MAG: phage tail protein [Proteobacteria bacterium]|nr:phage tail protein [Pseudomonadota bacterium]
MPISTAVDASAVARVVGIKSTFKDLRGGSILYLPQRIAVVGQGAESVTYSTDKLQVTSALQVAETYGYGSPLHLAAQKLLPSNGDGVGTIPVTIFPLSAGAGAVAATGSITPVGTQLESASYRIKVNNIRSEPFVVAAGATIASITAAITAAVNAVLDMPVIAVDGTTVVNFTAKWEGLSGNDIVLEVDGSTTAGIIYAVSIMAGGLVNPNVDLALANVGDVWETMFLNCVTSDDTDTLDKFSTFVGGRWGPLTRKPCIVFCGTTEASVTTAITVPDARKTDRANVQLVSPGSKDLPFVVAARQLARIAVVANNNPAHDYGSIDADGLTPGDDSDQWDYATRDQAVKAGSSTIEVKDGVINLSDTVTFYHPAGDPTPAYRFVVDIVKLMNIIFNFDLEFATSKWDGAPLIPDDQPTINPDAKKPKTAVAAACAIIDSLGLNAIISDPETAKANTVAEIDSQNPKRLNLTTTIQLSGNANIISVDLDFGFFFGTPAIVG